MSSRLVLALAAGLSGFYIYDVQANHGRQIDQLGLYNWNPAPRVDPSLVHQAANTFNTGVDKADDLRASAASWIGEKNEQVQDAVASSGSQVLDTLHASKNKLGSVFGNTKESAEDYYAAAAAKVREAQDKVDESKGSWISWGKEKNDDAEKSLEQAKKDLESAKNNLAKWGEDAYKEAEAKSNKLYEELKAKSEELVDGVKQKSDELAQKAKARKNAISKQLQQPLAEDGAAKVAADAVSGWGDQASDVARDQYESLFDKSGKLALKSQESAQKVLDYYNEQSKLAKKRYDETRSSWIGWRKAKSQEAQDAAKKEYENYSSRQKEAQASVNYYLEKAKNDAKAGGANLVDKAKNGLNEGHEEAQNLLSKAGNWIRG
ncbi:hypothetical protein CANARDRAFT_7668 [[Candida] arabinofermentans NRRL YB-2248]|uniref:Uncharacterized protein n=1 Tax=[Candida] arabinofermentans NRRL YB-2248 TaxID=983967 RepID=A0A1E4T1G5_9ASCO|nr:hypothetical protein CANARDRAFT_7668 [[Candida] arabinofermentans NRRL YB-2248]